MRTVGRGDVQGVSMEHMWVCNISVCRAHSFGEPRVGGWVLECWYHSDRCVLVLEWTTVGWGVLSAPHPICTNFVHIVWIFSYINAFIQIEVSKYLLHPMFKLTGVYVSA